ncbi:MAG: DUF58 domain-containing protein [Lentisphaerae bacterium]|nr:MAG: DUF58 domain-containing protein [Lentisphaerota bacterium]
MATSSLLSQEFLHDLEQFRLQVRRLAAGQLQGERHSRSKGDSTDFADYRNYVAGDDLRFLDWKLYARLERLFIKLFLQELEMPVHILLDCSSSMDTGTPSKFDFGRRLAAGLGYVALIEADPVSVYGFGPGVVGRWGPHRGRYRLRDLLAFLSGLSAQYKGTRLNESYRQLAQSARHRGLAFIISDFFDYGGWEDGLRHCLGHRMDVVVFHVLAPEEESPDISGEIELVDREFDVAVDLSVTPSLLRYYRETLAGFREQISQFVRNRGGLYVPVRSDCDFRRFIISELAAKGILKR